MAARPRALPQPDPGAGDLAAALADHEPVVRGLAAMLCRNPSDARDLVQDVFERALRHRDRIPRGTERAWLCTVTRNLFVDRARRRKVEQRLLAEGAGNVLELPRAAEPPREPSPWERLDGAALRAAVDLLSPKLREVYVRHAFEQQDYDHIAGALGIPKSTVGTRLLAARRRLRELLVAGGAEEEP